MKYYIHVRGEKIPVTEIVYKSYWQLVNHEKYLSRKDRKFGLLPFSSFEVDGLPLDNILIDTSIDIERLIEANILIEQLNDALLSLSDKEFEIINALYFRDKTIREVAIEQGMSATSLFRIRNTILNKLRKFFEN
ncbi:sigma-70 family RNA polymerase sigma factor [Streptococcus henryi]|uniref:sigma-70 family RNA polymerase sigma factor n=1 Tax=Streptococcus henryi TaxID=439219 RepID=UPI000366AAB4|nr:sigma-70 family RNA polymerase sigma factor [Streptococcus henryi]